MRVDLPNKHADSMNYGATAGVCSNQHIPGQLIPLAIAPELWPSIKS